MTDYITVPLDTDGNEIDSNHTYCVTLREQFIGHSGPHDMKTRECRPLNNVTGTWKLLDWEGLNDWETHVFIFECGTENYNTVWKPIIEQEDICSLYIVNDEFINEIICMEDIDHSAWSTYIYKLKTLHDNYKLSSAVNRLQNYYDALNPATVLLCLEHDMVCHWNNPSIDMFDFKLIK